MKKCGAILTLSTFAILSCGLVTGFALDPVRASADGGEVWEKKLVSGTTAEYTATADGVTAGGNHDRMKNAYINISEELYGDYAVSVVVNGSKAPPYPDSVNYQIGLMPWYIDDNNYVIAYMEWGFAGNRPQEMRCVQITGKINGKLLAGMNGNVIEWADLWQTGNTTAENSEIEFKVSKTRAPSGNGDVFTSYINGVKASSQTVTFRDTVMYDATPAHAGIYAFSLDDDVVTFRNYSVTQLARADSYHKIGETGGVGKTADGSLWSGDADGYSVTAESSEKLFGNAALLNFDTGENYTLTADVQLSELKANNGVGLVGWYVDEYNYLIGGLKVIAGKTYAGFEGKISTLEAVGSKYNLTTQTVEEFELCTSDYAGLRAVRMMKSGSNLILSVSVGDEFIKVADFSHSVLYGSGKVGLSALGCKADFRNIVRSDAEYVPYDWYRSVDYWFKAKEQNNAVVVIDESNFVFDSNAITEGDASCVAGLYRSSGMYDFLRTEAKFGVSQPIGDRTVYGIYAWVRDCENYLSVSVTPQGVTIGNNFVGNRFSRTYALPQGFDYRGTKSLSAEVLYDGSVEVILTDGETPWKVTDVSDTTGDDSPFVMTGYDVVTAISSGVFVGGAKLDVSDFRTEGYTAYTEKKAGEWSMYGVRYGTWTLEGDGMLAANAVDGVSEAEKTYALLPNENKNFNIGAQIFISSMNGGENKAGLVPYYLDENNYLFVYLDQWKGARSAINIVGKINGVSYRNGLGEPWNAFYFDYRYLGKTNALEVQLNGNTVNVYLNRRYMPVISLELAGLGERDLTGAKSGVCIYGSNARFNVGDLISNKRIYRDENKPTVSTIGTVVECGLLGGSVELPHFTAKDSEGNSLTATVRVFAPNGEDVAVFDRTFTTDQTGVYRVEIAAEDRWGNVSDTILYRISVSDETTLHMLAPQTEVQTSVKKHGTVLIPVFAYEDGSIAKTYVSITRPDGTTIAVTGNSFEAGSVGTYTVSVKADGAMEYTYKVVAEKVGVNALALSASLSSAFVVVFLTVFGLIVFKKKH